MGYRDELGSGRDAFGHLIRVWHERNGWSQRVLPALSEELDLGRVHNSQLSNLRNRKLVSPGPELFLALGRINQLLAAEVGATGPSAELRQQLTGQPELLAALNDSACPVLGDDGQPLGPAEMFEIFVGIRKLPHAFDLRIAEAEAAELSAALAELLTNGQPWRSCRQSVLAAYPPEKRQRREHFAAVMAGLRDYNAAELEMELPELFATARTLGVAADFVLGSEGLLLHLRRQKARHEQKS